MDRTSPGARRPPSWLGTLLVVVAVFVIAMYSAARLRRSVRAVPSAASPSASTADPPLR